jgi:hypothetical protein
MTAHGFGGMVPETDTTIYLFPGQGSDYRLFKYLEVPQGYDTVHMSLPTPEKNESLPSVACRFIPQIDTSAPFVLLGVSLGGMICTELTDTLNPCKTIIISSAKCVSELPRRYTFQKKVRINRAVAKRVIKGGARILHGIVEPDGRKEAETFQAMLKAKDPQYMKRSVDMIINWDRTDYPEEIIHIHGDNDHTIPIKNVEYDYLVPDGSHVMIMTRTREINQLIQTILRQ